MATVAAAAAPQYRLDEVPSSIRPAALEHWFLTHGHYGDDAAIRQRYSCGLALMLEALGEGEPLPSGLTSQRILNSPVLRAAIEEPFRRSEPHVLARSRRLLFGDVPPTEVGPERDENGPALWSGGSGPAGEWFVEAFEFEIACDEGEGLHLRVPDDREGLRVREGALLASRLLPTLAKPVLDHILCIALVDGSDAFQSATIQSLPGTVFVNVRLLASPSRLAEALFHEALHVKLQEIHAASALLRERYTPERACQVRSVWNPEGRNLWPTCRALAACHVYAHLVAFHLALREQPECATDRCDLDQLAQQSLARARYLASALLRDCLPDLRRDGVAFVRWLAMALGESWTLAEDLRDGVPLQSDLCLKEDSSDDTRFQLGKGTLLRHEPELDLFLAVTTHPYRVHRLNRSAWMIASMCDRPATAAQILGTSAGAVERDGRSSPQLVMVARALESLERGGLVNRLDRPSPVETKPRGGDVLGERRPAE